MAETSQAFTDSPGKILTKKTMSWILRATPNSQTQSTGDLGQLWLLHFPLHGFQWQDFRKAGGVSCGGHAACCWPGTERPASFAHWTPTSPTDTWNLGIETEGEMEERGPAFCWAWTKFWSISTAFNQVPWSSHFIRMIFYISYKGQRLSDLCACIPALSPNAMSQVKDPCSLQTRPRPTFPSITSSVFSSPSQTRIKHTNCFRAFLVLVFFHGYFLLLLLFYFKYWKISPGLCGAPHSLPFSP